MDENTKLIFVYNAQSNVFAQVGDLIHKTISPKTYQCRLCGLTYSGISVKGSWKDFINSLPIKSEFLHKDEFIKRYPQLTETTLPVVFRMEGDNLSVFVSTEEINKQNSLEELEDLIRKKL